MKGQMVGACFQRSTLHRRHCGIVFGLLVLSSWLAPLSSVQACGGFFCQNAPIDQAGEQIIFRQEGSSITAMVRILYSGSAEEFSWVVPVPTTPELSVGADVTFNELDFQTRPQFILERRGQECSFAGTDDGTGGTLANSADSAASQESSGGVAVEEVSVGPYEAQIVSSDDPTELGNWLRDNDYQLTQTGNELIAPYVQAGMKFVALKLRNGETSGSIQPLIMKYQSEKPMIPIRLTAIAAQDDMGILVWVVGDSRAVPENFPHVIPNYTRLNWYTGPFNAYASYQSLITDAMNEAGGQGFATDFAGFIGGSVSSALTRGEEFERRLMQLDGISNDAEFLTSILNLGASQNTTQSLVLSFLQNQLPLPTGFDRTTYFDQFAMTAAFSSVQLSEARIATRQFYLDTIVEPVNNSIALLPDGAYMTRLYTTLSASEMTLDPVFTYNTAMPEQPVERNAVLEASCSDTGTRWTLTLGAGTGRAGEVVIEAGSDVPLAAPDEVTTQRSVFQVQETSALAAPVVITENAYETLKVGSVSTASADDSSSGNNGFLGLGRTEPLLLVLLGVFSFRRSVGSSTP